MPCLNVNPSAPDMLNDLAGLSEFFNQVFTGISKTGDWLATNQGAVVNLMTAAGKLRNQGAATAQTVNAAYQQNLTGQAIPVGMSTAEWQAMQAAGAYQTPLPSWVLPVGLGVGALVLVMLLLPRRGGGGNG